MEQPGGDILANAAGVENILGPLGAVALDGPGMGGAGSTCGNLLLLLLPPTPGAEVSAPAALGFGASRAEALGKGTSGPIGWDAAGASCLGSPAKMLADGKRLALAWHGASCLGSLGTGLPLGWDGASCLGSLGTGLTAGTRLPLGWDGASCSGSLHTGAYCSGLLGTGLTAGTRLALGWDGAPCLGSLNTGLPAGTRLALGWDGESGLGSLGKMLADGTTLVLS